MSTSTAGTIASTRIAAAKPSLLTRMVVAIGNSIEASAKARARRETVRILRGLDDRMLKDIGIDRSEIDGLVLGAGGKTSRRS